jgi:ectoine hydroxylase-related dioxygenase (phytanoyl-CoA dioxygenase family)
MSRGTDRHLSAWIPLGAVAPHEGALLILEESHRNEELATGYLTKDADRDGLVWLDDDPAAVQDRYGTRWLTTDYAAGDVLIFSMKMLHGAFDNESEHGRCRLSTDSRYLVAGETPDPRWNGDDINPHGRGRVFYPGLGSWENADFQDEWKYVDDLGRLKLPE